MEHSYSQQSQGSVHPIFPQMYPTPPQSRRRKLKRRDDDDHKETPPEDNMYGYVKENEFVNEMLGSGEHPVKRTCFFDIKSSRLFFCIL